MNEIWLDQIGPFKVEHHEIKRQGGKPYYPQPQTGIGVLHTTEGRSVDGAVSVLASKFSPSHFVTGENRIVQLRPLTAQASSLRNGMNSGAQVQIEMSAITQMDKHGVPISWVPEGPTLQPTVHLMAHFAETIPLVVPVKIWDDNGTDIVGSWAVNNSRRKQAAGNGWWPKFMGWWEHLEVPNQGPTWHWDCGMMRRTEMLGMAQALVSGQPSTVEPPTGESLPVTYTVKAGDGFYVIAQRLGVTPEALAIANGLTLGSVIHPGQMLKVPVKT